MIVIQKYYVDSISRPDRAVIGRKEQIVENNVIPQRIIIKLRQGLLSDSDKIRNDNWSSWLMFENEY
jgi:hypothetical protein